MGMPVRHQGGEEEETVGFVDLESRRKVQARGISDNHLCLGRETWMRSPASNGRLRKVPRTHLGTECDEVE